MLFNNNPFTTALIGLFIFIFLAGAVVSAAAGKTDVLNFLRNGAEADRVRVETQWQIIQHQMELPFLTKEREAHSQVLIAQAQDDARIASAESDSKVALITAQTDANINRIRAAAQQETDRSQRELDNWSRWNETSMNIVTYFGLTISIILGYLSMRIIYVYSAHHLPVREQVKVSSVDRSDPWQDVNFRRMQRSKARRVEQQLRQINICPQGSIPIFLLGPQKREVTKDDYKFSR